MADKTQKEMLQELYQAVIGIPENVKDNGMIGKIDDIEEHLRVLNGQVARNTTFRKIGTWVTCLLVTAVITALALLFIPNDSVRSQCSNQTDNFTGGYYGYQVTY